MAEQIDSAMIPDERICIVPVGYDILVDGDPGCPIIEDANLPALVAENTRLVLTNPFGINTPAFAEVEVWVDTVGLWGSAGFVNISGGRGVISKVNIGEGVIVQTGQYYLMASSAAGGGSHGYGSSISTAQLCRVYVTRGKQ